MSNSSKSKIFFKKEKRVHFISGFSNCTMMNFDFRVGCMPAVYAIPLKYGHLPIFYRLSRNFIYFIFMIQKKKKMRKRKGKIFYIPWEKPFSPSRSCDAMMIKINKYT